ncbi:MAG: hypothetical protein AB9866_11090 [Syntrophobacteraceae bacterium]
MPRATKKFGHAGRQLTIRDYLSLDPSDALKIAMSEALKEASQTRNLSRAQVVDAMNALVVSAGIHHEGKKSAITEDMLNKWVARGSTNHQIPVKYIPAFCQATGSMLPIEALLPPGAQIIDGEEVVCLKWAKVEIRRRELTKESRRLAQEVGIE